MGDIRIYVHDVGDAGIADIAAKVFNLYAAKEAILSELDSENQKNLQ